MYPIHRNVNRQYNKERKVARARALIDIHARDSGATYVNAAEYQDRRRALVQRWPCAVTGDTKAAARVCIRSVNRAEGLAIFLAR